MAKIGLDIGHGSNTFPPGKGVYRNGKGYAEHDFNSKLGLIIKDLLEKNGHTVILGQQPNRRDVPLGERRDVYRAYNVDLVVSVHANASGDPNANGRCVFYWHTNPRTKRLARNIARAFKNKGYTTHGDGTHASMYNSWTNLYVTRAFPMDSILIEHGFMTGNRDFDLIFGKQQNKYIEDMAQADTKEVVEFLGGKYKSVKPSATLKVSIGALYRVQVGAFKEVASVAAFAEEVQSKSGFETYVTEVNDWMKVQVGAFANKKNAEERLDALKKAGYTDAFITTESGHAVAETEPYNDPVESAKPQTTKQANTGGSIVDYLNSNKINSSFANRKKLAREYLGISNYTGTAKQNIDLLNAMRSGKKRAQPKPVAKSISQMADEVIANRHGNGHENRRKSLGISSSEYAKVRAEVNRRAGVSVRPQKTIEQMAREVVGGKHGNGHANRQRSLGVDNVTYQKVRARVNQIM